MDLTIEFEEKDLAILSAVIDLAAHRGMTIQEAIAEALHRWSLPPEQYAILYGPGVAATPSSPFPRPRLH